MWCAISIADTNCAPWPICAISKKNLKKKFQFFFLNLGSLWLNMGSISLISSQIALCGQTSHKVTHPHTTPARARLTS